MPVSSSIGYRSGFLNLPPRIQLRDLDSALGSYPTIARTGDKDFLGKFSNPFDDNRTILFLSSSDGDQTPNPTVRYPVLMYEPYPSQSNVVASPNGLIGTITGPHPIIAGTSDALIHFNMNNVASQSLSPFDESRIYIDPGKEFYQSGTSPDILPGFSSRLADKTQIVIDINPASKSEVYFSTGSASTSACSAMAYYNFDLKRWDSVARNGDFSDKSNIDILNSEAATRHRGCLGFSPSSLGNSKTSEYINYGISNDALDSLWGTIGCAQSNYGFPYAPQYDATGSFLLDMSDYITHPFLLEKVVIDFSSSFGYTFLDHNKDGPEVKTFFILNQFANTSGSLAPRTLSFETRSGRESSNPMSSSISVKHQMGMVKDIVTFGQITLNNSFNTTPLSGSWKRDLTVSMNNGSGYLRSPQSGEFRLEFPVRSPAMSDGTTGIIYYYKERESVPGNGPNSFSDGACEVLKYPFGGRQGTGDSSGRSFVSSIAGLEPAATVATKVLTNYPYATALVASGAPVILPASSSAINPYVLLPTDKLVIGFENTPPAGKLGTQGTSVGGVQHKDEQAFVDNKTILAPGVGKITFYGSLIRESQEYHETYNQPLTSDAIHEALHFDNPVLDQFDTNPVQQFAGSFIDEVYGGNMAAGTRGVVGKTSDGTQGTTGSLLRGFKLADTLEIYYDSIMPKLSDFSEHVHFDQTILGPGAIQSKIQRTAFFFSGALDVVSPGDVTFIAADASLPFPYNGNPNRVFTDDAVLIVSSSFETGTDPEYHIAQNYDQWKRAIFMVGGKNEVSALTYGDTHGNTSTTQLMVDQKGGGATGFRYGIVNINLLKSEAVFRRDKYGQFRDMLEQRHDTAFWSAGKLDSPIKIIFVERASNLIVDPSQTSSQNLSIFATSSLPYFDGETKDRTDNPDETPLVVIE